ncbi:MAG: holo-ACP synthase [Phycisphaerales bacterium]
MARMRMGRPGTVERAVRIIGHGIDLVENQRIAAMLDAHGERFTERCFTVTERSYAEQGARLRVQRYAVRFAAKEAVLKALGTGWADGISWTDIEVLRLPSGEPKLLLSGRAATIATEKGVVDWWLSMSHTDQFSMASAIACGTSEPRGE